MGKVNSHNMRKVLQNTNIPNLWISQIFWVKQKSIQFPKYGKSEFTEISNRFPIFLATSQI